ncbi:MAG: condensation domain-containing protein [Pseudomonadota bacterium]
MTAFASRDAILLLDGLRYLGISVDAEGAQLKLSAPAGALTPSLQAALRTRKSSLMAALAAPSGPARARAELPLSFEQERVWLGQQLAPHSPEFNLALVFRIDGTLSPEALGQALTDIALRHEILRTVYVGGTTPAQTVREPERVPLPIVDLASIPESDRVRVAERVARAELHRPFDLQCAMPLRAMLVRLDQRCHWLVISRHHIAADGWSLGLFLRELVFAYRAFRLGNAAGLPSPKIQYARYAVLQRLASDDDERARDLDYWRVRLRGADPIVFPHAVGVRLADAGAVVVRALDPASARTFAAWCRDQGVTAFAAYLAAFLVVLAQRSGRRDLLICTDYANRDSMETESVIGMFVRRLPLRCELQESWRFLDLARHAKRVTFEACGHASVPMEIIGRLLDATRSEGVARFQVMFGMHGAPAHAPYRDLGLHGTERAELMDLQVATNEFPLSLYVSDTADGPVVVLRHDEAVFSKAEADLLLLQLQDLVDILARGGDPSLKELQGAAAAAERKAAANYLTMRARRFGRRALETTGAQQ